MTTTRIANQTAGECAEQAEKIAEKKNSDDDCETEHDLADMATAPPLTVIVNIPIRNVHFRYFGESETARKVSDRRVRGLMQSISTVGIINPLRVRPMPRDKPTFNGELGYQVTAGKHRLEAARKLGLATVPCIVVDEDDLHAELATIDENLYRAELTPAECALQTARRKVIYLELHPETEHGANLEGAGVAKLATPDGAARFTADAAAKTGKSERAIRRHAERGEKIAHDVLDQIRGTELDTGAYLDGLKKLEPEEQRAKISQAARPVATAKDKRAGRHDADEAARAAARVIGKHVPGGEIEELVTNLQTAGAAKIAAALSSWADAGTRH